MASLGSLIVRLALEGVPQYRGDLRAAAKDTQDAAKDIEQAADKSGAATGNLTEKMAAARQVAGAARGDFAGAAAGLQTLAAGAGVAATGVAVLAAGFGAVGYAAYKGIEEQISYHKALQLTGNAAGTNASRMNAMAEAIGGVVGTQGQAAAALTAMASTGRVAGQDLEKFSQIAVEMQRTLGVSVEETATKYAALGADPVKASLRLNETTNYLTASTFAQIKAAEELGDKTLAASLAQHAAANADKARTAEIEANLNVLGKAWRSVGEVAAKAWDSMLNVGRDVGLAKQLEQQKNTLVNLETQLSRGGLRKGEIQEQVEAARVQLTITQEAIRLEGRALQIKGDQLAAEKEKIGLIQKSDDWLTKEGKKKKEIASAEIEGKKMLNAGLITQQQYEAKIAEIRAKGADKAGRAGKADNSAARELEKEAALLATLSGVNADYQQQLTRLQAIRAKGNITEAQYVELVNQLIAKQPVAGKQMADMAKQARELAEAQEKVLAAAYKSADSIAAQADKQEDLNATFGLGKSALEELKLAQMEKSLQDLEATDNVIPGYINALELQIAAQKRLAAATKGGELLEANKKLADEQIKSQVDAWKKIDDVAHDTFVSIFDSGKSAFDRLKDTLKNGLYSLLYQMTVKKWLVNIVASTSGAGVAQQAFGATAGGMGNMMGYASNASSLYSAATGYSSGMNSVAGFLGAGSAAGSSAAALGYGNAVGMIGGDALGAMVAANASWQGVAVAATTAQTASAAVAANLAVAAGEGVALAAGTQAAAAAAASTAATPAFLGMGPVGWAALAAVAAFAIFSKSDKIASTSTGSLSRNYLADGTVGSSESMNIEGNAGAVLDGLHAGFKGLQTALGLKGGASFAFGAHTGNDGDKPEFRIMGNGFDSGLVKKSEEAMALAASRVIFAALKSSELPRELAGLFNGFDPANMSQDDIAKVYAYGQALKVLDVTIGALNFAALKDQSYDMAQTVINMSGGIENLNTNLAAYYENFYSAEEKRTNIIKNITAQLNAAGGNYSTDDVSNASLAQFRAIAESASTAPQLVAALIAVSGAFASTRIEAAGAGSALADLSDALKGLLQDRSSLEADLLEAQGNTGGAKDARRAIAIAGFSTDEAAVKAYDYNDALRVQITTLTTATAAAAALASTNKGLSDQLAILKGTETERSLALRDATDATTRSLLEQIHAQQNLNTANEKAAAATQALKDSRAAALQLVTTAVNDAFGQVTRAADKARTDLTTIYDKQTADYRGQLDTVGQSLGKLQGLSGKLKSTLDGMTLAGSEGATRAAAQQTIAQLLATARSGGGLPLDSRTLDTALSAVAQPSEKLFGSFLDYARDFDRTARDISALSDLTDKGLTDQQQMQATLEAQLAVTKASYDSQIELINGQVRGADALANNTSAVLSMSGALALLNTTVANLNGVRATQAATTAITGPLSAAERADVGNLTAYNASVNGTSQNLEIYRLAAQKGLKADQVDTLMGYTAGTAASYIQANGLPMLADGGMHSGGLRVVGERGWEVEATGPSRIWNQGQLANALRGGPDNTARLEALVERLLAEVAQLRSESAAAGFAIAKNTGDQVFYMRKDDTIGTPPVRAAVPA